jgi:SlyX protein
MEIDKRLTDLETLAAHQSRLVEDLNEIVTRQTAEIDRLTRRVTLLLQRAAEQEADQLLGNLAADQKPPHY